MNRSSNFNDFLKDRKGQEFDVFKLLISAVVAVVILGLLLSIINSIGIIQGGDPQKEAGSAVKEIMHNNATLKPSSDVTFNNAKNSIINASAISSATSGYIQPNEVCISAGQFKGNSSWAEGEGGTYLEYKGSTQINAIIVATCDSVATIKDIYGGSVNEYMSKNFGSSIGEGWFDHCSCINDEGASRCCFVAVKRPG